jgi:hypothetical protein
MANGKRGEVSIVIGDASRVLKLDFNAIAELEEMHGGRPVHELFNPHFFGIGVLRNGIYCALRAGDPRGTRTLTPQKVGEWLAEDPDRIEEIARKLVEAMEAGAPSGNATPQKPAPVAAVDARPPVNVPLPAHLTRDGMNLEDKAPKTTLPDDSTSNT